MVRITDKLNDIFNDDEADDIFGPIEIKNTVSRSSSNVVINNFEEIIEFYECYKRQPSADGEDPKEASLWFKLDGIRKRTDFMAQVKHLDNYGLLDQENNISQKNSVADTSDDKSNEPDLTLLENILNDNEFEEMFSDAEEAIILGGSRAVKAHERENVDQTNREPCPSFGAYSERFKQYKKALEEGSISISTNRRDILEAGDLFLWDGFIALLTGESIDGDIKEHSGKRLHIVFSNGTEAWLREGSIKRSMYAYGDRGNKVVCKRLIPVTNELFSSDDSVLTEDSTVTGYIYVVRTLSKDKGLEKIRKSAVKIGVTKNPVAIRLANAKNDPTFLCADVDIVNTYTLHNLIPHKVESSLHAFFGEVRLKINALDRFGKNVTANEWFVVSPKVVNEAIQHLIKGTLVDVSFDKNKCCINYQRHHK